MNVLKRVNDHCRVSSILCTLLIAAIPATSVFGLPIGYPEDFNGCSTQSDQEKRDICCDSVATDCDAACAKLYDRDKKPGAWIICGWDCSDANRSCKSGSTVNGRIDWPGRPGLQIPGINTDRNRIVTDEGIGIGISTRSAVIEIRSDDRTPELSTCAAVVTSCHCPLKGLEYDAVDKECRPVVSAGAAECRICSTGESSQACEPCDDCIPVILSVRPCADAE